MDSNLIILLSIIFPSQGDRLHRHAFELTEDTTWLKVLNIENVGLCCEGWPENAQRGVVAVTWQCEGKGKALPWQCIRPAQNHTLFFYSSSGTNSEAAMKDTWTPFTYYDKMFNKLSFETCWSNWKSVSEELFALRREFVRFGTTMQDEMPEYSPVETVTISHALGGGFWNTDKGHVLASSLGISRFPKDLAPKTQTLVTEIQLKERTVEVAEESVDLDMPFPQPLRLKRSTPAFHRDYGC
jgi:hypothetical protein